MDARFFVRKHAALNVCLSVIVMLLVIVVHAQSALALPYTFLAGTTAKAAEVNANFTYLEGLIFAMASNAVPPGTVVAFAGVTPPTGWLLCDGSMVSRSTYSTLFAVIGTTHGSGDNVSTFHLPDYRGRFLRGVDGTAGRDPDKASRTTMNVNGNTGNAVGTLQGDAFQGHWHQIINVAQDMAPANIANGIDRGMNSTNMNHVKGAIDDGVNGSPRVSKETRPQNAYVNWIIKY